MRPIVDVVYFSYLRAKEWSNLLLARSQARVRGVILRQTDPQEGGEKSWDALSQSCLQRRNTKIREQSQQILFNQMRCACGIPTCTAHTIQEGR